MSHTIATKSILEILIHRMYLSNMMVFKDISDHNIHLWHCKSNRISVGIPLKITFWQEGINKNKIMWQIIEEIQSIMSEIIIVTYSDRIILQIITKYTPFWTVELTSITVTVAILNTLNRILYSIRNVSKRMRRLKR